MIVSCLNWKHLCQLWVHLGLKKPDRETRMMKGEAEMERTATDLQVAEELVGTVFSTPKELRHLAEQSLGQLFVPTEVVSEGEHAADFVLHTDGMGDVLVHAERERHWYPYQITRVDTVRG